MKRKILSFLLIGVIFIGLTGCGKKQEEVKKEEKKLDITGSWYLNRNTAVDPIVEDKMYGTLRNLFGDSLGNGDGALKINNDGSFSIELGVSYNTIGKYNIKDNIISFYDIKDKNIANKDSLKEREENLKLEYIEYNNHKFMKMLLYDFDYEIYIFFEKVGSYADDDIPKVDFSTKNNEDASNNSGKSNYEITTDGIKINGYTIKYGKYSNTYKTTQTESWDDAYTAEMKIKINANNTVTMYGPTGEEADYPFTIENNTIKVGNNIIEVVGNNKVKFSVDDLVLEYKGE